MKLSFNSRTKENCPSHQLLSTSKSTGVYIASFHSVSKVSKESLFHWSPNMQQKPSETLFIRVEDSEQ